MCHVVRIVIQLPAVQVELAPRVVVNACASRCTAVWSISNVYLHQVDYISIIVTQFLRVSTVMNIYSLFIDLNLIGHELQIT
jgi:hypothetical protein